MSLVTAGDECVPAYAGKIARQKGRLADDGQPPLLLWRYCYIDVVTVVRNRLAAMIYLVVSRPPVAVLGDGVEPSAGFEPATVALQRRCSGRTELRGHGWSTVVLLVVAVGDQQPLGAVVVAEDARVELASALVCIACFRGRSRRRLSG